MAGHATIELFRKGRWQAAGTLTPVDTSEGYRGASRFAYLTEYAAENAGPDLTRVAAVSCRYPVNFDTDPEDGWPAFALDLLPSGYGRDQWLRQLDLPDGAAADWPLMLHGTAFPPGNLRVAEAVAIKNLDVVVPTAEGEEVTMREHPGFDEQHVVDRIPEFNEYAFQHGIYAAGGTDVQGVAPKLLLATDRNGRWHAEGVLDDDQVTEHWLVKQPRGNRAADRKVLRNEAAYMRVARAIGLNVFGDLRWKNDNLFVPRFDRRVRGETVTRLGLESLCSLAGAAEYRATLTHNELVTALLRYSTTPDDDLLEYIRRDVVNVVMGNKDNHARNTAVLKCDDGAVHLSPLYDFAPMDMDPEGIVRTSRWDGDAEIAGTPQWSTVIELFPDQAENLRRDLRIFAEHVGRLDKTMRDCEVDDDIIDRHRRSIDRHANDLAKL